MVERGYLIITGYRYEHFIEKKKKEKTPRESMFKGMCFK